MDQAQQIEQLIRFGQRNQAFWPCGGQVSERWIANSSIITRCQLRLGGRLPNCRQTVDVALGVSVLCPVSTT